MAVKKNEIYSKLYASCDKLRGGMDPSQYKDYILTILFVKYVTDKFKGVKFADIEVPEGGSFDDLLALRGKANIGEGMDKVIAKLAEANDLEGVINNAHFNDENKLGKGQEMVDKLTGLINNFNGPEFDFRHNKTSGDDILGDAYEYLMKRFAVDSGKSKGQFYTPAEVSRVMAKIVGIGDIKPRNEDYTVYDPACGSGSLLIRAVDEAPFEIAIYGQEKDVATAGLAKMNLVLHNKSTGVIKPGDTFSSPQYFEPGKDKEELRRFDFAVVNPPYSLKNWTDGFVNYGRLDGYGATPPEKNADYAWLLHIIKSLKTNGKAVVILPHGVLFRGNAEGIIRKNIIDKGLIKAIISLPSNMFYGTGIPACIVLIDKENADERSGIFMIDASRGFIKDGNKNRLREEDIYKIVTTYKQQDISDPHYARFVSNEEIKKKNAYNLNVSRYIDSGVKEDIQDIEAHIRGGIPAADVDSLDKYWKLFPKLKEKLFSIIREGYYGINVDVDEVRSIIYNDETFATYADKIEAAFKEWTNFADNKLCNISDDTDIKQVIVELADVLVQKFDYIDLISKYDVYEVLLSYWNEIMADDCFVIKYDGYDAGRETVDIYAPVKEKKNDEKADEKKKKEPKPIGWEGKLIPKGIIMNTYYKDELAEIDAAIRTVSEAESIFSQFIEDHSDDEDYLVSECSYDEDDKEGIDSKKVAEKLKEFKKNKATNEDWEELQKYQDLLDEVKKSEKILKDLQNALDIKAREKYADLKNEEIVTLIVNDKWYLTLRDGINDLYKQASYALSSRITVLGKRYEYLLPDLQRITNDSELRVKTHLERMGFLWE